MSNGYYVNLPGFDMDEVIFILEFIESAENKFIEDGESVENAFYYALELLSAQQRLIYQQYMDAYIKYNTTQI